jgi:hypothetical protein
VDEALASGLLQTTGRASGPYASAHAIVRDALGESHNPDRAARMHRRAAEALARLRPHDTEASLPRGAVPAAPRERLVPVGPRPAPGPVPAVGSCGRARPGALHPAHRRRGGQRGPGPLPRPGHGLGHEHVVRPGRTTGYCGSYSATVNTRP